MVLYHSNGKVTNAHSKFDIYFPFPSFPFFLKTKSPIAQAGLDFTM